MSKHQDDLLLVASGLSKRFDEGDMQLEVLKSIDFSMPYNDCCAIVGASGSGKSTLLHLLGGLDKPSSGSVRLCGQAYSTLSESARGELRNKHLGFVYQFHHLLPEFSVLDNVAMPLMVRRLSVKAAREQAAVMLESVGLSHRLLHKPSELSGGERQRTAIARALVTRPDCLMADEPTGNLDSATADKIYDLLMELQQQTRMSLIIVTHDTCLAGRMNRILHMRDGQFVE